MFKKIVKLLVGRFLSLFPTLATSATMRTWNLSNPTAIGALILYDGFKGKITSSVLITPNAPQVAKIFQQNEVKVKPIVDTLENNAKYTSGI